MYWGVGASANRDIFAPSLPKRITNSEIAAQESEMAFRLETDQFEYRVGDTVNMQGRITNNSESALDLTVPFEVVQIENTAAPDPEEHVLYTNSVSVHVEPQAETIAADQFVLPGALDTGSEFFIRACRR